MEVVRQLHGAFALIFKSSHYPGELVAAKRGSPLLLGIVEQEGANTPAHAMLTSEGFQTSKASSESPAAKRLKLKQHVEYYFASDASAMVEHTKRVLHLEDDDVAHLHDGGYGIYRMERILSNGIESPVNYEPTVQSAEVERTVETLKMEVEQIMKGNFKHFMQKEIHEQPEAMMQGMRGRMVVSDDGKTAERVFLGGMVSFVSTIRRSAASSSAGAARRTTPPSPSGS